MEHSFNSSLGCLAQIECFDLQLQTVCLLSLYINVILRLSLYYNSKYSLIPLFLTFVVGSLLGDHWLPNYDTESYY